VLKRSYSRFSVKFTSGCDLNLREAELIARQIDINVETVRS